MKFILVILSITVFFLSPASSQTSPLTMEYDKCLLFIFMHDVDVMRKNNNSPTGLSKDELIDICSDAKLDAFLELESHGMPSSDIQRQWNRLHGA